MQLIDVLAAGVAGAGNGFVQVFARGTSTKATCYADYDGVATVAQPSGGIELDSNGGTTLYVNECVDVVVRDSTGVARREFTVMGNVESVEYRGTAFTGVDYVTGVAAVNEPVSLKTILDRALTSFGATNWNVLLPGGSSNTLQQLAANTAFMFINVKDPTYGATGDGTTDDTAAIQAALDAATNYQTVVFPNGTYRITAQLNVPSGVTLLGTGLSTSVIWVDSATAHGLVFASVTPRTSEIRMLTITPVQSNTGQMLRLTGNGRMCVYDCYIGSATYSVSAGIPVFTSATWQFLTLSNCQVAVNNNTALRLQGPTAMIDCVVTAGSAASAYSASLVQATSLRAFGCTFDLSACGSGTMYAVAAYGATPVHSVVGCKFVPPSAGTAYCFYGTSGTTSDSATTQMLEHSNIIPATGFTAVYYGWAWGSAHPMMHAGSRAARVYYGSATLDVSFDMTQYGLVYIARTSSADFTINVTSGFVAEIDGAVTWVVVQNNSGGAIATITVTGADADNITTLADTDAARACFVHANNTWHQVTAWLET